MKYGNKKISVDGIEFDSKKEARRYSELKLMERAGLIEQLELQKLFTLIPAQYETFERYGKTGIRLRNGERCVEKSCTYRADFCYVQDGRQIVEDTKGVKTKDYIIKRKLMLWVHGVKINEI